jgi:hypothetical protein
MHNAGPGHHFDRRDHYRDPDLHLLRSENQQANKAGGDSGLRSGFRVSSDLVSMPLP